MTSVSITGSSNDTNLVVDSTSGSIVDGTGPAGPPGPAGSAANLATLKKHIPSLCTLNKTTLETEFNNAVNFPVFGDVNYDSTEASLQKLFDSGMDISGLIASLTPGSKAHIEATYYYWYLNEIHNLYFAPYGIPAPPDSKFKAYQATNTNTASGTGPQPLQRWPGARNLAISKLGEEPVHCELGDCFLMDLSTNQMEFGPVDASTVYVQFSVSKQVWAVCLAQAMELCQTIDTLQFDPKTIISDVLDNTTGAMAFDNSGRFVINCDVSPSEVTKYNDFIENNDIIGWRILVEKLKLVQTKDSSGNLMTKLDAGGNTQPFTVTDYINSPITNMNNVWGYLGEGGTDSVSATVTATDLSAGFYGLSLPSDISSNWSVTFNLLRRSLSARQKVTVADCLTEQTGMPFWGNGMLFENPSMYDSDTQQNFRNHSFGSLMAEVNSKAHVCAPGKTESYGDGTTYVINMARVLYSKYKFVKTGNALANFDITQHLLSEDEVTRELIFEPCGMNSTRCNGVNHLKTVATKVVMPALQLRNNDDDNFKYYLPYAWNAIHGSFLSGNSVVSNGLDMALFGNMLLNDGISPKTGTRVLLPNLAQTLMCKLQHQQNPTRIHNPDWTSLKDLESVQSNDTENSAYFGFPFIPGDVHLNGWGCGVADLGDKNNTAPFLIRSLENTRWSLKFGYGGMYLINFIDYEMTVHFSLTSIAADGPDSPGQLGRYHKMGEQELESYLKPLYKHIREQQNFINYSW